MPEVVRLVWVVLAVVVGAGGGKHVRADEEDPLQHASPAVTRNRTLQDILNKLALEYAPTLGDTENTSVHGCEHTELVGIKVLAEQLTRFQSGVDEALRLANLLNVLYLATPSSSNTRSDNYLGPGKLLTGKTYTTEDPAPPHYYTGILEALAKESLQVQDMIVSLGIVFVRGEFREGSDLWGTAAWRDSEGRGAIGSVATLYNSKYDSRHEPGTGWFTELQYR